MHQTTACLRAYMQAYRFTSQKLRHGGPLHLRPVFGVANPAKGEFTDRPKHVIRNKNNFREFLHSCANF